MNQARVGEGGPGRAPARAMATMFRRREISIMPKTYRCPARSTRVESPDPPGLTAVHRDDRAAVVEPVACVNILVIRRAA